MAFQRLLNIGSLLAVLPLLAACNQTAMAPEAAPATAAVPGAPPSATPGVVGSGAIAAIMDYQETQARQSLTSTVANTASAFDPTHLSAYGIKAMNEEHARIERQKGERMLQEIDKVVKEAEALGALHESMERQKAASGAARTTSRRKITP
jgi:hypothetical protein